MKLTALSAVQFSKACSLIVRILSGKVIFAREVQLLKADLEIVFRLFESVTDFKLEQFSKADSPIAIMLSGKVMPVIPVQP